MSDTVTPAGVTRAAMAGEQTESSVGPMFTPLPQGAPQPNGAVMKALNKRIRTEGQRVVASGRLKPATIVNFNPIDLRIECALIAHTVPSYNRKGAKSVTVNVGGRKRKASYITVRDALFRPKVRNVSKPADADDPIAEYDVMTILPIEIVWQFWNEYFGGDNPIGGVLAFEGDIHVLQGKEREYRVPDYLRLDDGGREYYSKPANMQEEIERALQQQRLYSDSVLNRAYQMFQDPDQRKNIHNIDGDWADFALYMGWIQAMPAWRYASVNENEVCVGCGAVKKHPKAHFCVCGRPYDAFAAYMAGENVAPAYLVNLPKEQLEKVRKEAEKRRKLFAELSGTGEEAKA